MLVFRVRCVLCRLLFVALLCCCVLFSVLCVVRRVLSVVPASPVCCVFGRCAFCIRVACRLLCDADCVSSVLCCVLCVVCAVFRALRVVRVVCLLCVAVCVLCIAFPVWCAVCCVLCVACGV